MTLLDLVRRDAWASRAACRGKPTSWFFPPAGEDNQRRPDRRHYRRALEVCSHCPVRGRCLIEHLDESYGVFGGTTPDERRAMRGKSPTNERNEGCA